MMNAYKFTLPWLLHTPSTDKFRTFNSTPFQKMCVRGPLCGPPPSGRDTVVSQTALAHFPVKQSLCL